MKQKKSPVSRPMSQDLAIELFLRLRYFIRLYSVNSGRYRFFYSIGKGSGLSVHFPQYS